MNVFNLFIYLKRKTLAKELAACIEVRNIVF